MKLNVRLESRTGGHFVASLEDDNMNSVDLVWCMRPETVTSLCQFAALRLRQLADKFDALGKAENPLSEETQDRINEAK
jgi:protein-tyrosine-phosphatase